MKSFIFYTIKSVQEYCFTFAWRFNAGLSSFFVTNAFAKKLFFYGTLLLLGIGFIPNSYGQDVGSSAVKANFGIDGGVYSGVFEFQPNPVPNPLIDGVNTDDWFLGASGLGVIDEIGANPKSNTIPTTNTSFELRQSIFAPTAPFPFPVVPLAGYDSNNPATWTGKYLWLDAVYGRDTYVKGGNAETSYFAGTGDKNSDNPSTWAIGTSGSVPQKDDIIDVYAHLRGEGIRIPDPITDPPTGNPRPFTTLWAYAGASLVVTNGNKHVDFEFFRTALETPADLSIPGNTGPDGGRTAFTFNADDGSVAIPGTIIISVDYINGGNVPSIRVRVWMSQATFDGYTTKSASPFNVDKSVAFEKGTDSGNYGYAAINPIGGGVNMWGRVNDDFATFENSRTQAPPWNTWEGTTPTDVDMYTRYQFVEIGINLTAFGLDKRGDQSPCSNVLGSLLVKTRASGGGPNEGAFGSELKDFAGPYLFGNTGVTPVVTVTPKTACAGTPVDLTAGTTTTAGPIHYFTTLNNGVYSGEITTNPSPTAYTPSGTTTIYVRSESLTNPGCFGVNQFTVTVNAINPGTIAGDGTLCTPFNPAAFTSTTAGTGGGTISYQWQSSTTSCEAGFSNITDATSATYDAPAVAVTTYFRRVATSTQNGVTCSANSNCLTVTPNAINPGTIAGGGTLCTPFNPAAFTSTTAGTGGGTISYQWQSSITSCESGFSNITDATSATYDAPAVAVTTYFRRVATSTLNGVACSANSNCLTVTPNAVTPGTIAGSQTLCLPADPAAFTSTTAGTGGGTISYQWQSSTTSCESGFSNITDATSATYDAPAVAVTTYFRRVATSTLNGVACSANSNCLTITPEDIHPGEIAGSQTLCTPFNPAAFTSVTPGSNGGTISYQWQSSITSCESGFSNITDATSATYDAPAVAVTTYFRRVATTSLNGAACSANSNCLTVTPNAINPGVIAGSQTLCTPFNPAAFTSTTAGTGGGTISYQWQSSTTSCEAGFSNITDATSATYDAPAVAVTTYFRRVATSTLNGVACSANSNCLTVTPNAVTPGTIAGSQTLCTPADPAAFTSTTAGTGGGTISYQWQSSTTSCEAGFSNIADATSATYDAPTVSGATYFRRVATSTLNGVACSANSNCLTITPEDIHPGEIAGSQTLCTPFNPAAFTSVTPGSNGGTISYQWQSSTTSCESGFSNITDATSATYDAPAVAVTTYFRRVATTSLNGATCSANSNCLTVTPNAINPGVIAGSQTGCSPFDAAAFTSTTGGSTTGTGVISYQWQMSANGCDGTFTDVVGATSATYDAPAVFITTYFRRVATSTLNSVACFANSNCLTVTPTVCSKALCTYTQGAYGNSGGLGCVDGTKYTTYDLIARALASYGGTMTIGLPGHSVWMTAPDDIDDIINILPGGGGSKVLGPFDYRINQLPSNYLKNGKINNTLLAQTITLGLNLGIDGQLGNFELQAGTFAVAEPAGGCGADTPKVRDCSPGGFYPVINEYKYYSISADVVNAISPKTVQGLFALANQALGGGSTNGLTLSQIAGAVDLINNAFDECRIFVGYGIEPLICLYPIPDESLINSTLLTSTETARVSDDTAFTAYPVPFKDQLTVSYDFDYVTDVKIEVFNTLGTIVASSHDASGYLNREVSLNIPYTGQAEVYLVKVTTNRGSSVQKVISSR